MSEQLEFTPAGLMSQVSDSLVAIPQNPIDFFRLKASESISETNRINLLRAIDLLSKFTGGAELDFESFDEGLVGEWVSRLLFTGYTPKTISNNVLKKIATLYNKAVEVGLAKHTDVFRLFQNRLNDVAFPELNVAIDSKAFSKLQEIIRTDVHSNPRRQLAKDVLLFSIYMGGLSFEEIAGFKKDDYKGDTAPVLEIIKRYSKPKNKYLFPLKQSRYTPKQINRVIEFLFLEALGTSGLKLSSNPTDTSVDIWTLTAMGCGIPASDIAACIAPNNRRKAITAFVSPSEITEDKISEIRTYVVTTLTNNPLRWYAMHLRRHVDYTMLTSRMKERGIMPDGIYYPMEEILHKVGRKKVFETRPVISWLLFFRERVTRLNHLYNEIGDLAWGYRCTNDVKSPYAVISNEEIRRYQTALGTLTPDTSILPDEAVKFNEGDHLVILGGAMDGRHAVFVSEKHLPKNSDGNKIIFRVLLGGGKNANWIVDWDPRLVRKISESQYIELDRKFQQQLSED